MCDADTTGKMPQCEVCGECYPQWKAALETLSRNISVEVPRAYNLSLTPQQPGMFNCWISSSRSSGRILIWCSCGTKAEIFELSRATADLPPLLMLSGASRPENWTLSTRFRLRK